MAITFSASFIAIYQHNPRKKL